MGKEINKLKKQLATAGINGDTVIEELADAVVKRLPPTIDPDQLVEKAAIAVEARVGAKLSEVLGAVKSSGEGKSPDVNVIIEGVAKAIYPKIREALTQEVQQIKREWTDQFSQLEEIVKEKQGQQEVPINGSGSAGIRSMSVDNFLSKLLAAAPQLLESFIKYKQATQPSGEQLNMIFRTWLQGVSMGSKLKAGVATPEDLDKNIGGLIGESK